MTFFKYVYTGGSFTEGNGAGERKAHQDLGFVVIDIVLMFFVNFWMSIMVGKARKTAGVDYPNMYAYAGSEHVYKKASTEESPLRGMSMTQEAADQYNSVQRAHQNTVENQPLFLTMLLVGSLGFPAIAAAIGFLWLVSRVMYGVGYYKQPQARVPGAILGFLCMFALCFLNIAFVCYLFLDKEPIEW